MVASRLIRCVTPETRVKMASTLLDICIVAWPATHFLIMITKPTELSSWVGHLLMALSWGALVFTCVDIVMTTDVRVEQDTDTEEISALCAKCGALTASQRPQG